MNYVYVYYKYITTVSSCRTPVLYLFDFKNSKTNYKAEKVFILYLKTVNNNILPFKPTSEFTVSSKWHFKPLTFCTN